MDNVCSFNGIGSIVCRDCRRESDIQGRRKAKWAPGQYFDQGPFKVYQIIQLSKKRNLLKT